MPPLPAGQQWGRNGLKVLVYLGSTDFQEKNWEGVEENVCTQLSKWHWLLLQLSYRGRVLVDNNLVTSALWHRLVVLQPTQGVLQAVQRQLVNLFGSGQHWI